MPPNKKRCLRSRTCKKPKVPETIKLVPTYSKPIATKQALSINKDIAKESKTDNKIKLDPQSQKICLNVYKKLLYDGTTARENINTLVSFLTGVSEPMIAKIIENFQNGQEKQLKNKVQQKSSKNTSIDCIVINNLIQIEKECEPNKIGSIAFYEKKLNKRMHQNITISRDEIINYLNNIGIKWTDETINKPSTREIQTKNFDESISNLLESDNTINKIIKEENQEIDIKHEFIAEDIKLEDENVEIKEDDLESIIVKTEFVEVEDNPELYFINQETKDEDSKIIKEETTGYFDIEDALEPHVINTKSDEDEVAPLEFINMDQLHTNEILILEDNQIKHLPSLDYFVLLLQMHSFKYSKNSVAHCLKSLEIKYDSDDKIKSSCSRPILDPTVIRLLKEFNTTFHSNSTEIDPATKKIITEIGVKYDIKSKIPTFDFILQKVQEYDQNITPEILETWLNKLSVKFKCTIIKKSKTTNSDLVHKRTLPTLNYFFESIKQRRYRCTKSAVKKWLKLLCIEFQSNDSDLELISENVEKLSTPIIKLLIQLEKNFYKKYRLDDEKEKNTTDEISRNSLPTIDYFYNRLVKANYICHKSSLKKWLNFINIQHDLNDFTGDLQNHQQEELSSPLIKLLIRFDEEFNNLEKSPYRTLIEILEELDNQFKNKGTLPSLNFIHYYILSAKSLQPNPIYSREYLKEWLKILDINFNIEFNREPMNFYLETNLGPFFHDDSLPSLDYFYTKLNKNEYVCSRNTLKRWLDILAIKFESSSNYPTEYTSKKSEKILNSSIIHTLIKLEDNYNNEKNNFLLLVQMLRHLEMNFKMKNEVPTIDYFYKSVMTSKFLKNDNAYSKENLKWLLKKLNIDFKLEESLPPSKDSKYIPTLDYFYKKLSARKINFSKIEINAWLKEIGIKFNNDSNIDVNEGIQPLPIEINNVLHNIDNEFRLNALITHLKDLEFRLKRKRKYLTFTHIFQIIKEFNLFNTNQNSEHKRTVLKKWVKKLNIKFIDDEEMAQEEVAPLEYYYEKITSIKGNICSKNTLAHWLTNAGIIFRKTNDIIEDIDQQPLQPNISKILWKISTYYCLRDVEPILKKIQDRFISKGDTPSLRYLQKKLFDVKGYNYSCFAMRNWLNFVGIKYNNKRTAENNLNEKSKNTDLNDISMTEPDMETLTENQVITIVEDSKLQENMEIVEEWPTETIVIEEDDLEANTSTNSDSNIYEKISAPDKVMTLLTEVEYDFYKLRRVPSIEYFYEAVTTKFGNKYSKEVLISWLTKAGIRFQGKT